MSSFSVEALAMAKQLDSAEGEQRQAELQQNVSVIVLPLLQRIYDGWAMDRSASTRRGVPSKSFTEWAVGRPVAPIFEPSSTIPYDAQYLYPGIAISQPYLVSGHVITLETRGGFLSIKSAQPT